MAMREPRAVPAGHGLRWAREGLELFAASPAVWIGIGILFLLMGVVLSIIPFAGMLWSVVVPIHAGGLMLGCRALRQGQPLEVRYLFNGFEAPRLQPLALVGALYLAGSLIVMLPIIMLAVAGSLGSAFVLGSTRGSTPALIVLGSVILLITLAVLAGVMVLSLSIWFAPALVVFDDAPALEALKTSLRAGWMNVGAFTVYGLVMIGIGVIATLPLVASILLTVAGRDQVSGLAFATIGGSALFTVLCVMLLMPAGWGAMYASYDDVFGDRESVGVVTHWA